VDLDGGGESIRRAEHQRGGAWAEGQQRGGAASRGGRSRPRKKAPMKKRWGRDCWLCLDFPVGVFAK
jgi:hypothetical protein